VHPLGLPADSPFELNLASNYSDKISVAGWLASPKFDGLRCLWTGRELFTRLGRQLRPPEFFLTSFPCSPLDGELYSPRGLAHLLDVVVSDRAEAWLELTYWVFDSPGVSLQFRQRLESLRSVLTRELVFIRLVPFEQVRDKADVDRRLQEAEEKGFEGLVLRNPASFYERKRSWGWLKVKRCLDLEVRVLAPATAFRRKRRQAPGSGRPALLVETLEGPQVCFKLVSGVSSELARDPATLGRLLTVKCCGRMKDGRPRQPVFHRAHSQL
jgi:DNA ligase 1